MNTSRNTTLELIIERNDGHYWGRIEDKGFMPTGQGKTIDALMENVKESIKDYLDHEGKNDKKWNRINLDKIVFDLHYDVEAFFEEFDYLKITSIARKAGINESLLRQYATGSKYPSADQVKKIETSIHELAGKLQQASIYAA